MHFVLHIGPDKTGTSAAQRWFSDQRAALAAEGVLYSANGCGEDGAFNALVAGLLELPSSGDPEDGRCKHAAFRQDLSAFVGETVLLSAEDFSYRLMKKDNGISPRFGPKRVAMETHKLVTALRRLGATRITVLVVLRNEGDRAVSRVVQTIQDLRLPPLAPADLPPPCDLLVHAHHFLLRALDDLGIDWEPVLYKDDSDPRPLAARLLTAAGLAPVLRAAPPADARVNRSMGLAGCSAAMQIKDIILRNRKEKPGKTLTGLRHGHASFQKAYAALGGTQADTPFNGIGAARIAEVIEAQERINTVFRNRLDAAALSALSRSKWQDMPISPLRAEQMSTDERQRTGQIMDAFAREVRRLPKAVAIYGTHCLEAFDGLSEAFDAGAAA